MEIAAKTSKDDKTDELTLEDENGKTLKPSKSLKILGFHTNGRMRLDTHLSKTYSKIVMEKRKLSPAYNYMSLEQRKVILTAKHKSLLE